MRGSHLVLHRFNNAFKTVGTLQTESARRRKNPRKGGPRCCLHLDFASNLHVAVRSRSGP